MDRTDDSPSAPASVPALVIARGGLVLYTFLIVYASWYPFSGWRSNGLPVMAFLFAPLPYYWTKFDLLTNIVGYMPFGALLVFSMYPRLRGARAVLVACVLGALLSAMMEAGQNFLPSRVPSNLDLITNAAGVALGALCGALLTPTFLEQSRMLSLGSRWFLHEGSRGLIVLALWPLAQIYPQGYLFGHGQILPIVSDWLSELWSTQIDLGALIRREAELSAEQYWLSETIITACGFTGAVLTLLCLTRRRAPKLALALALISAALATKTLASALLFSPDNAFAWVTPGAEGGLVIGMIMLFGLALAPPVAQRRVAALALITSLLVVNAAPANPYFISTLQTWVQGKFLNFNGAAQFLSLAWPFIALWFLYHPVHRTRKEEGEEKPAPQ
jgi:VanZ family protein